MNVRASLRHLRMSPRKVRLVVDLIRGADVDVAERRLQFHPRWAARPVLKLLQSAIANATHNFKLDRKDLFVAKITADQGPTLKRYRPRAFGSAAEILKRSTHVMLVLGTKSDTTKKEETPSDATEKKDGETTKAKKTETTPAVAKTKKPKATKTAKAPSTSSTKS